MYNYPTLGVSKITKVREHRQREESAVGNNGGNKVLEVYWPQIL